MRVTNRKIYSQYYNGDNFTQNLTDYNQNLAGAVQDRKKSVYTVDVQVESHANTGSGFDIRGTRITRISGSFIGDGFGIGDSFTATYYSNTILTAPYTNTITGTITSLTAQRIDFTLDSGTVIASSTGSFDIYLTSYLTSLKFFYNIIENSDPTTFSNYIDGTQMGFYAGNIGIDSGGGRSTSFVNGTFLGNNDSWKNGSLQVRYVSTTNYVQTFEIEHIFDVAPFYQDSELTNLQTVTPPSYLFGNASLKYITQYDFRRVLTDPNSSKVITDDQIQGSVGYYDESFNGFSANNMYIDNLSYNDISSGASVTVPTLNEGNLTQVFFSIKGANFTSTTRVIVKFSYLPTLLEYQDRNSDFSQNYLFDSVSTLADAQATTPLPFFILEEVEAVLVSSTEIEMQVQLTVSDPRITDISNYLITAEVAEDGGNNTFSNKTTLIVDVNTFEKSNDISGLFGVDFQDFELFDESSSSNNFTDVKGWVEDSLNLTYECWLDYSNNAFLNSLDVKIVAYNPTTLNYFDLETINVPLSGTIVGGRQIFNTDIARGFNFPTKGDYNIIKLVNNRTLSGKEYYEGMISLKVNWQDWLPLPNADTVFYDASKLNNGLNKNSSNYSLKNGYEIRTFIEANVTETTSGIDTVYIDSSPSIDIYNYDLDDNVTPLWSGVLETFDTNGTNLGGALLDTGNTTIRATFNTTGTLGSANDYKVFISLNPSNSTDKNSIEIFYTTISIVGTDLIAETTVNNNNFNVGTNYDISSRLIDKSKGGTVCANTVTLTNQGFSGNLTTFSIATDAPSSTTVTIQVKQDNGTLRETLTGVQGDDISLFTSDFSNTNASVIPFLTGIIDDNELITFDSVPYTQAVNWWYTQNSSDIVVLDFSILCSSDSVRLITL